MKILTSLVILIHCTSAGFIDNVRSYLGFADDSNELASGEGYDQRIPYEVSFSDEKFIGDAIKLTGVAVSELDSCQHRVVLKLRSDCQQMNDEMISKMAVHLLNCQSHIEGRKLYGCNDQMTIRDCTKDMDSDAWNSYHLMTNRVRAVCFSIRQVQFRGITEHTVNRLMEAAQDQLSKLHEIAQDQGDLKRHTDEAFEIVSKGQVELGRQQKDLQRAQLYGQLAIEDNIQRLSDEKKLIIESQRQLTSMTQNMQTKLNEAALQLENQASESSHNHKELLDDLLEIQTKAQVIFQRIEDSSELLIKQSEMAQRQYEATLQQLTQMNETVHSLVSLVGGTKLALEERLSWIMTALGGTDDAVEKMYTILWHTIFLILAMVACAFLSVRMSTRFVVITVIPVNMVLMLYKFDQATDALTLGISIIGYIAIQSAVLLTVSFVSKKKSTEAIAWKARSPSVSSRTVTPEDSLSTDHITSTYHASPLNTLHEDSDYTDNFYASPTPPLSRNGFSRSNRSRSNTPLRTTLNAVKVNCKANTRLGTPCKLTSIPGRDYCHRHQTGDSVMG